MSDEWKLFRRKTLIEMRPYVVGEDLGHVSLTAGQVPVEGGFIGRNPLYHDDQWYVTPGYAEQNLEDAVDGK